jgi:hypothetical protein
MALAPDPSHVYAEEWTTKLQEALDEPNKFKDICRVIYTNTRVLHNPYLTDGTVATSQTRSCPYTLQGITTTDDSITISTFNILPQFIDRADLAQSGSFMKQMELAERQGILLNESIETGVYASHAAFTDFGTEDLAGTPGGTTQITVSATNIDDIIRCIKKTIRVANGESLLNRNGGFIVWRPSDFEILEGFMQANGFVTADRALGGGTTQGMNYMGLTHYSSNLLAANHVMAGVKKCTTVGILKSTYGQIMVNDKDPDLRSGISIVSRVDYAVETWVNIKPVVFDVNVS